MTHHSWMDQLAEYLPELHSSPYFDWAQFSSAFSGDVGLSQIRFIEKKQKLRPAFDLKQGIGSQLLQIPVAVAPLGSVLWMMSYDDMAKLFHLAMFPEAKHIMQSSEGLQEGFYRYLLLKALRVLQTIEPFKRLTLQIAEEDPVFEQALCMDVEICLGEAGSCWGRLAVPEEFIKEWNLHFSQFSPDKISSEQAKKIMLSLSLLSGSVSLSDEQWSLLKEGDFLLLDQEGYNEKTKTGHATLMLDQLPLFQVKIQENAFRVDQTATSHPVGASVEIGRMEMTLEKALHLKMGDLLQPTEFFSETVSLVLGKEKKAVAELMHLGGKSGLRILEIG